MTPRSSSPSADAYLPLKPVVLHILLALAERDLHGYAVMQAVRGSSEGRILLQTGPFYRHLKRLLDDGLVAEAAERPAEDDPRRGAYYRLTELGREVVGAETRRLTTLLSSTQTLGLLDRGRTR